MTRKIKSRKTIEKFSRKGDKGHEENEKIMALMLAVIMMMAMSVTAFAAEGATKGTLTVNVKMDRH